ncbi:MAG TPA: AraC family transcriptional regulator [Clostridia bacterium]|nr:AraC family transcriptional regulator [Clostridia bacterium]
MLNNNCAISYGYENSPTYKDEDLIVYHYGNEKCKGEHHWTGVRDHYLIHYITSGRGQFICNNKTHNLKAGQGFLICPNVLSYYEAHRDDPWEYCWVGFQGHKVKPYLEEINLSNDEPIFHCKPNNSIKTIVNKMIGSKNIASGRELVLTGLLYHFFADLMQNKSSPHSTYDSQTYSEIYVKMAMDFIEKNYSRSITIEDISDYVGIHRKYLSSLFKDIVHTSPQNFLINYRMNKACTLLEKSALSITHIAHSVGYEDALLFSKMFKKYKGMPPTQYRKRLMGQL